MKLIVGIKDTTCIRMVVRISRNRYSVKTAETPVDDCFAALNFAFLAVKKLKTIHHSVRCSQIFFIFDAFI